MSAKGHQSQGGKGAASAQLEREAEPQLCSKSSPSWHPPQSNLRTRRLGLESFHLASRKKGKCHTVPTPGKWNSVRAQNNTKDTQEQWKTSWILLSQPHFTQKDTKFPWHLYRRNVLRSAYTTCLSLSVCRPWMVKTWKAGMNLFCSHCEQLRKSLRKLWSELTLKLTQ